MTVNLVNTNSSSRPGPVVAASVVARGFDEFYSQARDDVARALAVTIGDADLAAEATDEAMVRAVARWATVSTYESPAGWVYRVGLNWSRSVLKRRGRREQRQVGLADATVDPPSLPDPVLDAAVNRLPMSQRSVVVCRYLLDLSTEETAAALKLRPGTVKSRLHRALASLRTELERNDPDWKVEQ